MCVMLLVQIFTLNAESQCPDEDDDVVHFVVVLSCVMMKIVFCSQS